MLGLTSGELFVVVFVTVAVVTAAWWPKAGAAVAEFLSPSARKASTRSPDQGGSAQP